MMKMSNKVKAAGIVLLVIVVNVVLWKCGVPSKWEVTRWIFN